MNQGKIIFLNGVSSSGKSTLASELTKLLPDYFHFSLDDFDLIIEKMEDRTNEHLIPVPTEFFYHQAVVMFSNRGINLIVDHVLHDKPTTEDCLRTLRDRNVFFVGVHCPVEELQRREIARNDRTLGQAVAQLEYVHQHEIYDVEVDTLQDSAAICARKIVDEIHSNPCPTAWADTIKRYEETVL